MQGILQNFFSLYRPLVSKLNELLSEYDLTYSLWQVIFYLKSNGSSPLVEIATHYNIEKPSITRRVQRLEEQSMVRVIAGADRREKIIELTDEGEEIYKICRQKITKLEYSLMQSVSENEKSITFATLPKIKANIINKK